MRLVTLLLLALSLTTLAGCSYLNFGSPYSNRDKTYLSAKSIPPLRIPPGLSSDKFHNEYPVSDRQYPEAAMDVSLAPPGLQTK